MARPPYSSLLGGEVGSAREAGAGGRAAPLDSAEMDQLSDDFAEALARVVEPGDQAGVAEVIQAATQLDDAGLRIFLEKFAARIRLSPRLLKHEELLQFLQAAKEPGGASAP
ncbi:MAG: hypothetical protein M3003_06525 [Candidatus Dormibacteraeota bacterium]|nr:hypothetical protein [Candidatus Dormibacteraeota bacterium]